VKFRIAVCSALVAIVAVVPTAAARPQQAQAPRHVQVSQGIAVGVATSIAAEIAKAGIKAAVAQWAPEYSKYVDPTAHALAQIQEQLAQLDAKLTELIDHQRLLGERLSCESQRVALGGTLAEIKSWYASLREQRSVTSLSARQANFESLFSERHRMSAAQIHLHDALVGNNLPNLIRSCAKYIEETERPFLSAYLEHEVWDFWSLYRTASAELLVVRVNMIALHPAQYPANKAEEEATRVQRDWAAEEGLIKPAFPDWLSYDEQSGWLWQFHMVPYEQRATGYIQRLLNEGWHVTGYSTVPTCSAVEAEFKKSGSTGYAAISWLYKHRIIWSQGGNLLICYDDHDRLHQFNLVTYSYAYAGDVQSYAPAIVARPNVRDGKAYIKIGEYSYIH
jgi:hypothetical protein